MDGSAILALKDADARQLFPGDETAITSVFHRLALRWHPDRCPDPNANEVFRRIVGLKKVALRMAGAASSHRRTEEFADPDGKRFEFRYRSRHVIDPGEAIVGDTNLCYVFREGLHDIFRAEVDRIGSLSFADERMRGEMGRFLPALRRTVTRSRDDVLVLGKTEDQFLLLDLIGHCGGRIDPVHVAWIVSGLENLACYLAWAGLCHGAIDPCNILVSPRHHSVALAGGWGFASRLGARPTALPSRTIAALPRLGVPGTLVDPAVDLDLIRLTARECLGDPTGGRLYRDAGVPKAMTGWLMMPPAADALADYATWEGTLERAFGKRRFVPWDVTPEAVYATA